MWKMFESSGMKPQKHETIMIQASTFHQKSGENVKCLEW